MNPSRSDDEIRRIGEALLNEDLRRSRETYGTLYDDVLTILLRHDPMRTVVLEGVDRRYQRMAAGLMPLLLQVTSEQALRTVLAQSFQDHFDVEPQATRLEAAHEPLASDIWESWERHRTDVLLRRAKRIAERTEHNCVVEGQVDSVEIEPEKEQCGVLYQRLLAILAKHDPTRTVADTGALDEYEPELGIILRRLNTVQSVGDMLEVAYEAFLSMSSCDGMPNYALVGPKHRYQPVANDLWVAWRQWMNSYHNVEW